MKELGYIVCDKPLKRMNLCLKVIGLSDFKERDITMPTLIVGWENAKLLLGEKFNILENKVNDTLYWCFYKNEKRTIYDRVMNEFIRNIVMNLHKQIPYKSINIFRLDKSDVKNLLKSFYEIEQTVFISDKTIYVYNKKLIYGISIEELEYFGIRKERIINILMKFDKTKVFLDEKQLDYTVRYMFKDFKYLFPYLLT